MSRLVVVYLDGSRDDFYAIADVIPPLHQAPPEPLPETIWWSSTGIESVQQPGTGFIRTAGIASITEYQ